MIFDVLAELELENFDHFCELELLNNLSTARIFRMANLVSTKLVFFSTKMVKDGFY